jgi:hypothetical protein
MIVILREAAVGAGTRDDALRSLRAERSEAKQSIKDPSFDCSMSAYSGRSKPIAAGRIASSDVY